MILPCVILLVAAESDSEETANYDEVSKSDHLRLDLDEFLKTYPVGSGEVVNEDGQISHLESQFDHSGGAYSNGGFTPSTGSGFIPSHGLPFDADLERLKAERHLETSNLLAGGGGSNGFTPHNQPIQSSYNNGYRPEAPVPKKGAYRNNYEGNPQYNNNGVREFSPPGGHPNGFVAGPRKNVGHTGANYKNVAVGNTHGGGTAFGVGVTGGPTGFTSPSGPSGFRGHKGATGFTNSVDDTGPASFGKDFDDFRAGNSFEGHAGFSGPGAPFGNHGAGEFDDSWRGGGFLPQHNVKPIIHKHVYVHAAPPDDDPPPKPPVVYHSAPPKQNYQIVFIKAPAPPTPAVPVIPPPPQHSDKTLIYVLHSKPEEAPPIKIPSPPPSKPNKPEVFFIRYKGDKGQKHDNHFPHLPPGFQLPPSFYHRRFGRNDKNNVRLADDSEGGYSEENRSAETQDHWSEETGQSTEQKPLTEPASDAENNSAWNEPGSEADSSNQDPKKLWDDDSGGSESQWGAEKSDSSNSKPTWTPDSINAKSPWSGKGTNEGASSSVWSTSPPNHSNEKTSWRSSIQNENSGIPRIGGGGGGGIVTTKSAWNTDTTVLSDSKLFDFPDSKPSPSRISNKADNEPDSWRSDNSNSEEPDVNDLMRKSSSDDILKVFPKPDSSSASSENFSKAFSSRKSDDLKSAENSESYVKVSFHDNVISRGKNAH